MYESIIYTGIAQTTFSPFVQHWLSRYREQPLGGRSDYLSCCCYHNLRMIELPAVTPEHSHGITP